jgi:hypothetical protein
MARVLTLVLVLAALVAAAPAGAAPAWPQWGHDAAHTFVQPDEAVLTPKAVRTLKPTGPVIRGDDDTVISANRFFTGVWPSLKVLRADNFDYRFRFPGAFGSVAAGDGKVATVGQQGLAVYDARCETACAPLWHANGYFYGEPVIYHGWVWVPEDVTEGDSQAIGVVGMPLGCRTDGGACTDTAVAPEFATGLTAASNKLFFTSARFEGRDQISTVVAYSETCLRAHAGSGPRPDCHAWTASTHDRLRWFQDLSVRDGRVFAVVDSPYNDDPIPLPNDTSVDQVAFIPTACRPVRGDCDDVGYAAAPEGRRLGHQLAVTHDRVYVPTLAGLVAYPVTCRPGCTPVWSAKAADHILAGGVSVAGDVVYTHSVGTSRDNQHSYDNVAAFDTTCTALPCRVIWDDKHEQYGRSTAAPLVAGGRVYIRRGSWTAYAPAG